MSTYKDLQLQIARLQAQAEEERAAAIAEVKQKIVDYELSLEDLDLQPPIEHTCAEKEVQQTQQMQQMPLMAKYQNPRTGQTWSGRGKPPKWIIGKNKERFLIS